MHETPTTKVVKAPDTSIIIEAVVRKAPEKRVAKLVEMGVLKSLEGYTWGTVPLRDGTRFFVFANARGVPVPMYKTEHHSGGKRPDVNFFPFFGYFTKEGWFIKGDIGEINSFYEIPELETISKILTKTFKFNTSRDKYAPEGKEVVNGHGLNELLKKRFDIDLNNFTVPGVPNPSLDNAYYAMSDKIFDRIRRRK